MTILTFWSHGWIWLVFYYEYSYSISYSANIWPGLKFIPFEIDLERMDKRIFDKNKKEKKKWK